MRSARIAAAAALGRRAACASSVRTAPRSRRNQPVNRCPARAQSCAARRNVAGIARHRTSVAQRRSAAPHRRSRRRAAAQAARDARGSSAPMRGMRSAPARRASPPPPSGAAAASRSHAHGASPHAARGAPRWPRCRRVASAQPVAYGFHATRRPASTDCDARASAAARQRRRCQCAARARRFARTVARGAGAVDGGGEPVAIGDGRGGVRRGRCALRHRDLLRGSRKSSLELDRSSTSVLLAPLPTFWRQVSGRPSSSATAEMLLTSALPSFSPGASAALPPTAVAASLLRSAGRRGCARDDVVARRRRARGRRHPGALARRARARAAGAVAARRPRWRRPWLVADPDGGAYASDPVAYDLEDGCSRRTTSSGRRSTSATSPSDPRVEGAAVGGALGGATTARSRGGGGACGGGEVGDGRRDRVGRRPAEGVRDGAVRQAARRPQALLEEVPRVRDDHADVQTPRAPPGHRRRLLHRRGRRRAPARRAARRGVGADDPRLRPDRRHRALAPLDRARRVQEV